MYSKSLLTQLLKKSFHISNFHHLIATQEVSQHTAQTPKMFDQSYANTQCRFFQRWEDNRWSNIIVYVGEVAQIAFGTLSRLSSYPMLKLPGSEQWTRIQKLFACQCRVGSPSSITSSVLFIQLFFGIPNGRYRNPTRFCTAKPSLFSGGVNPFVECGVIYGNPAVKS